MLIKATIQGQILAFLQAIDADNKAGKSIAETQLKFAEEMADTIIASCKTIRITIPSGMVSVTGSSGVSTNPAPIIIEGTLE